MNDYKKALRAGLRATYREQNDEECRRIDREIIQRVISSDLFQNSQRVFLFASAGKEVYTHDLIELAYAMGKTVALPRCYDNGIMHFYRYNGILVKGKYNIPEPDTDELLVPKMGDLMLVPGLAFDSDGYRVGQGGGYYDRYLEKQHCTTVGVCRNRFLLTQAPRTWNDLPVNYVITESDMFKCENGASVEAPL